MDPNQHDEAIRRMEAKLFGEPPLEVELPEDDGDYDPSEQLEREEKLWDRLSRESCL
jgi:hypothetical protein